VYNNIKRRHPLVRISQTSAGREITSLTIQRVDQQSSSGQFVITLMLYGPVLHTT